MIQWPKEYPVGPCSVIILEVTEDDLNADESSETASQLTPCAIYDGTSLVIAYGSPEEFPRLPIRIDNDICHEIAHSWEDLIMAHGHTLTEGEIQGLGNALHQLLTAVLQSYGVDLYGEDPTLEVSGAEGGCSDSSDHREVAEEVAPSDDDRSSGTSWSPAGTGGHRHPDGESRRRE